MKILVWLLALALPIQNLAVVALQLRGPSHFHAEAGTANGLEKHAHSHEDIKRHFHGADLSAIEVDVDDHRHDTEALESSKRTSFNALDTLTPAASRLAVAQSATGSIVDAGYRMVPPPFPGRLERPPSSPAARIFS